MTPNEYQKLAYRTANTKLDDKDERSVAGLGLSGEAGEVAGHIKKNIGHGQPLNHFKMEKELGDVLWYAALLCTNMGWTLEDVMQTNIDKLKDRWPDGFDETLPQAAGDNEVPND